MPFLSLYFRSLVTVIILTVIVSCSKSKDNPLDPDPKLDTAYLPAKIFNSSNKLMTDSFAYNADNTVKEIFHYQDVKGKWAQHSSFLYNSQHQCIGGTHLKGDILKRVFTIEYKGNETFVYSIYSEGEVVLRKDTFNFVKNSAGLIPELKIAIRYPQQNLEVRDTMRYTYLNDNLNRWYHSLFSYRNGRISHGTIDDYAYEYDNMPNSLAKLFEINPFLSIYFNYMLSEFRFSPGKNNFTSVVGQLTSIWEDGSNITTDTIEHIKITNTFDEKTGMMKSQSYVDKVWGDNRVYEYTYKKISF